LPSRRDIEIAVAAYNATDPETPLTPAVTRLLVAMFAAGDVCQRSLDSLAREGFDRRNLPRLLRALIDAGFVSKEQSPGRVANVYRLHLPPLVRR
jgi:hypothetical protein